MISWVLPSNGNHRRMPGGLGVHTPVLTAYSALAAPKLPATSRAPTHSVCHPEYDVSTGDPDGTPKPQSPTPEPASLHVNAVVNRLPSSYSAAAGDVMAIDGGVVSR